MPNQNIHPALSQILPLDRIPNEFEGINEAISNVFNYIFVKKLIYRLAGTLGVGFMDHTHLMEDGAVVALSSDDPLRENLEVLQAYLDTALDNLENGIRGALININALT